MFEGFYTCRVGVMLPETAGSLFPGLCVTKAEDMFLWALQMETPV